ncbi:MAG: ParB/RepB/Spo0J family partition protein [Deltaproteobacteria bacterium]|jgi:ParB family chromosome partitioning protein|nr:ParB/RepB/Spo0J family partition protein [Deltaproteobacteria bacterium]
MASRQTIRNAKSNQDNGKIQKNPNLNDSSSIESNATNDGQNLGRITVSDEVLTMDINLIEPDPKQPRKLFDPDTFINLKNSISTNSLLDPILVRNNEDKEGFYLIVDGERRWRASKDLNLTTIKCRVVMSDNEGYAIVALTQNMHRDDLLPIEKANAFSQLLARLQGEDENVRQKELIKIVNLSENYISEILKISTLDDTIKEEALKSKRWSTNKLLQLAKIKNTDLRVKKFDELKSIINKKDSNQIKGKDQVENTTKKQIDDVKSSKNKASQGKQIIRLNSRSVAFTNYLEKFKKIRFDESEKDLINPSLTKIVDLINYILS